MALAAYGVRAQETKIKSEDGKLKAKPAALKKDRKQQEMNQKLEEAAAKNIAYPYKAEYSAQLVPGSPMHAQLVLNMWKYWDDNALDKAEQFVADTILFQSSDGTTISGKEAFMNEAHEQRDKLTKVKSFVDAWMPLNAMDRNENWVAIWGREEGTDREGVTSVQLHHEIWRINKDGKVDFMRQYTAAMPVQPQKQ